MKLQLASQTEHIIGPAAATPTPTALTGRPTADY